MTPAGDPAIGYIRFSTGHQAGLSDATQRQMIEEYAASKKLRLVEIVSDQAVSGKVKFAKRAGGQRVEQLLQEGAAKAVIVTRIDRPWRNIVDCLLTLDEWNRRDIHAHIIAFNNGKPLDTSQPLERMLVSFLGVLAEYERSLIGARVKESLKSRQARGLPWNHAPFGTRCVRGKLVADPRESRVLKRVLELHAAGMTPTAIARQLVEENYKNRRGLVRFQCHQIQRYLRLNKAG